MNDRFPVFRKQHKERVGSSSLLPLMEERRVSQPPRSSRTSAAGANTKSSRLPKPPASSRASSSRPTISRPMSQPRGVHATSNHPSLKQQTFLASTSLPYLDRTPRTASLSEPDREHVVARPHSFPPRKENPPNATSTTTVTRLPPRVSRDPLNASLDPFKVHANRVLRPSASSSSSSSSSSSIESRTSLPPPRSSSLLSSSSSSSSPVLASSSSSTLRRTATVRSAATRNSTASGPGSGSVLRPRNKRRKASISGAESFIMARTAQSSQSSSSSNSRYPPRGQPGTKRRDRVLEEDEGAEVEFDEEEEEEDDDDDDDIERDSQGWVEQWKTFVRVGGGGGGGGGGSGTRRLSITPSSPLLDQRPPSSFRRSPSLVAMVPASFNSTTTTTTPNEPPPPPPPQDDPDRAGHHGPSRPRAAAATSRSPQILSISPTPRELSQTLPQLNRYLHTRTSGSHSFRQQARPQPEPAEPRRPRLNPDDDYDSFDESVRGATTTTMMTRVDSEVLLTRLTLKRLGSTGFEGDALDRLGRGGGGGQGFAVFEEEEEGEEQGGQGGEERGREDEDEVDDWADRYRDSSCPRANGSYEPDDRPRPRRRRGGRTSTSSSSDSSSRASATSDSAWDVDWRRASSATRGFLPTSESSSTMTSDTSVGTSLLSRNWSKSTLMEQLEKEVGRLSRDFEDHRDDGCRDQDQDDGYVCALDLIWQDSSSTSSSEEEDEGAEVPVRRGGAPLPTSSTSRLPRPMRASRLPVGGASLLASGATAGRIVRPVAREGFVSKLAKPTSVSTKLAKLQLGWV